MGAARCDAQRGEVFGLVDSNGSGKSTLLKVVARILRPAAGRVVVYVAPAAALELYGRLCDEAIALDGAALVNAEPELAAETDDARPARLAERLAGATALLRAEADLAALRPALATSQTELTILQLVLEAREAEVAFLQPALAAREIEIAGFTRELGSLRELLAAREIEIAGLTRELGSTRELLRTDVDVMALN